MVRWSGSGLIVMRGVRENCTASVLAHSSRMRCVALLSPEPKQTEPHGFVVRQQTLEVDARGLLWPWTGGLGGPRLGHLVFCMETAEPEGSAQRRRWNPGRVPPSEVKLK